MCNEKVGKGMVIGIFFKMVQEKLEFLKFKLDSLVHAENILMRNSNNRQGYNSLIYNLFYI